MNKRRGRPTLYGLDVITGERIKRARIALASGSSRKRIALDIFKVSPRTFRRYLATDHPVAKALKSAVKQGELLKDEPLALLICMLIDQHNKMIFKHSEAEKEIELKRNELEALREKINNTVKDNEEVKQYLKKDGRKNYTVSIVEEESIEPVDLNKITEKLGVEPFNLNNYLYKEQQHSSQLLGPETNNPWGNS